MKTDTEDTLSLTSRSLHWLVGVVIIGLVITGVYMESQEVWALYPWHKSIGMLILLPALARVLWRLRNGLPSNIAVIRFGWQQPLVRAVHLTLLALTLLMPLSGMMMSGFGGYGLAVFGLELVAANPDPANPGQVIAFNATLSELAYYLHGAGGTALMVLISVHVLAALKHHFVDRDRVLKRMLGK